MSNNFWVREIEIQGFSQKTKSSETVTAEISDLLEVLAQALDEKEVRKFCEELRKSYRRLSE